MGTVLEILSWSTFLNSPRPWFADGTMSGAESADHINVYLPLPDCQNFPIPDISA